MRVRLALTGTAAALVVAVLVYVLTRTPQAGTPAMPVFEPRATDADPGRAELVGPADLSTPEDAGEESAPRSPVAEDAPRDTPAAIETHVLHVVVDGISAESARQARITITAAGERRGWPRPKVRDAWPCQGRTSELDLDPFFARVAERIGKPHDDQLEVVVEHPLYFSETARVPFPGGVPRTSGETVYEVQVKFAEVAYWPELDLTVRDARTRAQLDDVELRMVPTAFMGLIQQPGSDSPFTLLGTGLSSPIALRGGRKADESADQVAGIALPAAGGGRLRPTELSQPEDTGRGVMVYARAPAHAWGRIVIDVSTGGDRELLLEPATALHVRLANVQLERYAALEQYATLRVSRIESDGEQDGVWNGRIEESLEFDGVRLEALEPGEHVVSVTLGDSWKRAPLVLARQTLALAPGETQELLLELADAPAPPKRVTLAGVLSFPTPATFDAGEDVRLELYPHDYLYGDADRVLALAEMKRTGGALPTWSFRVDDLPAGVYELRLLPFLKSWIVEVPDAGLDDLELIVPELAEVIVESVDARTGERIPLESIRFGDREDLPGRVRQPFSTVERNTVAHDGEPGRFRFWAAPGAAFIGTWAIPDELDIGYRDQDLELFPGLQTVRFELAPPSRLHFEFRVDGAALPTDDGIFSGLQGAIRAVDHDGEAGAIRYWLYEATAPGLYEIDFSAVGAGRFLPIPPRRVEVREGETTKVIIDLQRK